MKFYKLWITLVLTLLSIAALTNCSSRTCSPANRQDARYRSIAHNEFPAMAQRYGADTKYLLLVDYSLPSNQDRFFLWDTEKDCIIERFWVAHGYGGGSKPERPVFSNTPGSRCSSLGWFLVERWTGVSPKYGYPYHAVDGLSSTNSNARVRQLLIHPWGSVDEDHDAQIQEPMTLDGRCEGCFTTSEVGYAVLDEYIKSRNKRILLYAMYDEE